MVYIRKRMSFADFWEHISIALIVASVIIATWVLVAVLIQATWQEDRMNEQNLYWALRGKTVKDERAMKTAAMAKQIYQEGFVIQGVESWKRFSELLRGDSKNTSYAPNSITFAFNHWDKVVSILENPEKEAPVKIPTWPDWFIKVVGPIGWFILAISLSIGYVWVTNDVHRDSTGEERRYNKVWQYPWNRFWAWLMIPVMLPYIVFVQSGTGIYFLIRQINGADARERREEEAERRTKELRQKLGFEESVNSANSSAALEESRRAWVSLQANSLKEEKNALEKEKKGFQTSLADSGRHIEKLQRSLAETKARLEEIDSFSKVTAARNQAEIQAEFNALLWEPSIRAIEVSEKITGGGEIRIYTETIYIPYEGQVYEIGDFLITIFSRGSGRILIENLRNTSSYGLHHPFSYDASWTNFCFGNQAQLVADNLKRKNFYPLILFILQAIKTAQGDSRLARIPRWRAVET